MGKETAAKPVWSKIEWYRTGWKKRLVEWQFIKAYQTTFTIRATLKSTARILGSLRPSIGISPDGNMEASLRAESAGPPKVENFFKWVVKLHKNGIPVAIILDECELPTPLKGWLLPTRHWLQKSRWSAKPSKVIPWTNLFRPCLFFYGAQMEGAVSGIYNYIIVSYETNRS